MSTPQVSCTVDQPSDVKTPNMASDGSNKKRRSKCLVPEITRNYRRNGEANRKHQRYVISSNAKIKINSQFDSLK